MLTLQKYNVHKENILENTKLSSHEESFKYVLSHDKPVNNFPWIEKDTIKAKQLHISMNR